MKNIKFRAYIKDLRWVVPIQRINFDVKTIEVDSSYENGDFYEYNFHEVELMQYTGLYDKNRKEIYVGDIVRYSNDEENGVFEVKYNSARFYALWIKTTFPNVSTNLFYLGCTSELEVIGNIYNNPELINGELNG